MSERHFEAKIQLTPSLDVEAAHPVLCEELLKRLYGSILRNIRDSASMTASHIIIVHPIEHDAISHVCTMKAELLHTESFNDIKNPTVMFAFHNPKYRFTNE